MFTDKDNKREFMRHKLTKIGLILEELEKICNCDTNSAREHNSLIYLFTQLLENSEKDGKCDIDLIIEELEYRLQKAKEVHSKKVA